MTADQATLRCQGLTKQFGGLRAVDEIDVGFRSGQITALVGPNGAGKTTLFHLITGALRPDAGRIYYCQQRIDGLPPWQIARMGIGRLFQDVRVFNKLTVRDNVMVAFSDQRGENPLRILLQRALVAKDEREFAEQARYWLGYVGLDDQHALWAEELSYGEQKLLALARLLAFNANVLLLDEPTAGVNPNLTQRLLDLIEQLARQGRTVVVIEHNMNVVVEIADEVYFIDEGRIVAAGPPGEVLGNPEVRDAYLGL